MREICNPFGTHEDGCMNLQATVGPDPATRLMSCRENRPARFNHSQRLLRSTIVFLLSALAGVRPAPKARAAPSFLFQTRRNTSAIAVIKVCMVQHAQLY
jgi:hypothetical protein